MSHITKVRAELQSLDHIETAVEQLGGTLHRDVKEFETFAGKKEKCEHAITFPNAKYGIGVVSDKKTGNYSLKLDFYSSGGLTPIVGRGANTLKQEYSIAAATAKAEYKGFTVRREQAEGGVVRLRAVQ